MIGSMALLLVATFSSSGNLKECLTKEKFVGGLMSETFCSLGVWWKSACNICAWMGLFAKWAWSDLLKYRDPKEKGTMWRVGEASCIGTWTAVTPFELRLVWIGISTSTKEWSKMFEIEMTLGVAATLVEGLWLSFEEPGSVEELKIPGSDWISGGVWIKNSEQLWASSLAEVVSNNSWSMPKSSDSEMEVGLGGWRTVPNVAKIFFYKLYFGSHTYFNTVYLSVF